MTSGATCCTSSWVELRSPRGRVPSRCGGGITDRDAEALEAAGLSE